MSRRYTTTNPLGVAYLRAWDAALSLLVRRRPASAPDPKAIRRLLVGVGGHLGDAVIATSTLSALSRCYPHIEIGVVAGSWAREVFGGHPAVRWLHVLDHPKLDRSSAGAITRLARYQRTFRRARAAIRDIAYDAAVDLYPWYPNMAALFWSSGVPFRAGYDSGGFGRLYTKALPWHDADVHMAERHLELLRAAGLDVSGPLASRLSDNPAAKERVAALLPDGPYVVLHPGAGSPTKEWTTDGWRALASFLRHPRDLRVIITGRGSHDRELASRITNGAAAIHDLVDQLSWSEYVEVIRQANLVIAPDTVAGHVASAVGTPWIALFPPGARVAQWRPLGDLGRVVSTPASVDVVIGAVDDLLASRL